MSDEIPSKYRGWWRIVDTGTWVNDGLDSLGPARLSLTGDDDRLRMHCLLAHVTAWPTKSGVSFRWHGAWEFDERSGSGTAKLGKDGRLRGKIRIRQGDDSTFIAEPAAPPSTPIPELPSYRDKWRPTTPTRRIRSSPLFSTALIDPPPRLREGGAPSRAASRARTPCSA